MGPKKSTREPECSPPPKRKRESAHGGGGDATGTTEQPTEVSEQVGSGEPTQGPSKARKPGIYEPKLGKNPIGAYESELYIFKTFQKMTILVDTTMRRPGRACFVERPSGLKCVDKDKDIFKPVDPENYFTLQYEHAEFDDIARKVSDSQLYSAAPRFRSPPGKSTSLIAREASPESDDSVKVVLQVFRDMAPCLKYSFAEKVWTFDEEKRSKFAEKLISSPLYQGHVILTERFRSGEFIRAFSKRMTNGPGKVALKAFIDLAIMVSYGQQNLLLGNTLCTMMGGGPDKTERFPLSGTLPREGSRPRSRGSTPSVSSRGGTPDSVSSVHYVKLDDKGVYADVFAITGCEPNWPHFLIIGEVKNARDEPYTKDLSESSIAQLTCEMLGAMLHQSLVFGILMNDTHGHLCKMTLDFEKRVINVKSKNYGFVADRDFHYNGMERMFLDVVGALDECKKNIKEVCH